MYLAATGRIVFLQPHLPTNRPNLQLHQILKATGYS